MNEKALKSLLSKYDFKKFVSFVGYWSHVALDVDNVEKDQVLETILSGCRLMMEILDENEKRSD